MTLQVDRKELDDFCPRLFRALDGLGLLPLHLWAKPNEFEKFSRLLFGGIQRYGDVEAGFKEWESRVLRDARYRRDEHYPKLEALRQYMTQHEQIFTRKTNLQHLRTSLYARIFQYCYPRRVMASAYCVKHQGNAQAIKPEFVEQELPRSITAEICKLQETYGAEWETIVADAKASLIANAAYYDKVLRGQAPATLSEERQQIDVEESDNQVQEG
jgi:hypothetical protein